MTTRSVQLRLALVFVGIFVSCATLSATSVIGIVTTTWVHISADSLVTDTTGGTTHACKIALNSKVAGALSGAARLPGFDALAALKSAVAKSTTAVSAKDMFTAYMNYLVPPLLSRMAKADTYRETYDTWTKGAPVVQAMFASFEASEPHLWKCSFLGRLKKAIDCYPANPKPQRLLVYFLGFTPSFTRTPDWDARAVRDPVRELERAIEGTSKKLGGKSVGGPLTTVRVDSGGACLMTVGACTGLKMCSN